MNERSLYEISRDFRSYDEVLGGTAFCLRCQRLRDRLWHAKQARAQQEDRHGGW